MSGARRIQAAQQAFDEFDPIRRRQPLRFLSQRCDVRVHGCTIAWEVVPVEGGCAVDTGDLAQDCLRPRRRRNDEERSKLMTVGTISL